MRVLVVVLFTLLTSCITLPAQITTYESKTDNEKHVQMEPAFLVGSWTIKLALHKVSSMPEDSVTLTVLLNTHAPATKDGLVINIDGKKSTFSSIDDISDIDQHGFFRKRYLMKMSYIREMVAGKSVWMKISTVGQTYAEGEFSKDQASTAKRGFINFLAQIDGVKK